LAALIAHLDLVLTGRTSWQQNATIKNAININEGVVVKEAILRFQLRESEYPHLIQGYKEYLS
jgi:N5-(carboxyethyl)ornithine synthase